MKKSAVLVLMALFTNGVAQAGNCDEATTQTAMNTCSAEAYQRAILKKAEVPWIALRDADCAFVSSGAEGGSMYSMIRNQCMI